MRTLLVRVLLVTCCVGLATVVAVPEDGDGAPTAQEQAYVASFVKSFRRAQGLLGSGKDAEAETLLRELLAAEPEAAAVHHALGTLMRFRGRGLEAGEFLTRASELAPDDGAIRRDAGLHMLQLGAPAAAEAHLAAARKLLPGDIEVLTGHGVALRSLGRRDAAVAAYREAMRQMPGSVDARIGLAACLALSAPAEAIRVLEPVAEHYTDAALAHGLALLTLKRYGEAVPRLVQSVKSAPRNRAGLPFLRDAAEALVTCGAAEEALVAARVWAEVEGERPSMRASFCLALTEAASGETERSLRALDRTPSAESATSRVRPHFGLLRASVLLAAGRAEQARPLLEQLAAGEETAFERHAALRLLGRSSAEALAAATHDVSRKNDLAWIESLVATAEGRADDRLALRRRAAELSEPPGEYPGLLVR